MRPLDLVSIASIRKTVLAIDPDDESFLVDAIAGETDAGELLDELLEMEVAAKAHVVANKERVAQLQERNARLGRKADALRAGMHKLLDATGLRKMERAAATVSIRAVPPKVVGEDVDTLPARCKIAKYSANRTQIKIDLEAGLGIDGWSMDNGGETISVRRS